MPLSTLVKVGGITHLSDARYCAAMEVNMLGFTVVAGQENYLPPNLFQEIRGWITGPKVVAEIYGIESREVLATILDDYKPDYLELSLVELRLFNSLPLPFILSVSADESIDNLGVIPAFLKCHHTRGTGSPVPLMRQVETVEDLKLAMSDPQTKAIAMHSGKELRPGLKDYGALADILEQLEID